MATTSFANKYALVRGNLFFRIYGSTGPWTPFGPTKDSGLEMSIEKTTLTSGDDGSVLDERQVAKTATFGTTLQSLSDSNLGIAMQSVVRTSPAVTDQPFSLPAMTVGQVLFLAPSLDSVTLAGVTEGVDYSLNKAGGKLVALKALTAAEGTYDADEHVEMGILAGENKSFELMYDATAESGIMLRIYKWTPSPAQNVSLNAGNEHTALALTGACIADDNASADDELGRFGRIVRVK